MDENEALPLLLKVALFNWSPETVRFDNITTLDENEALPKLLRVFEFTTCCKTNKFWLILRLELIITFDKNDAFPQLLNVFWTVKLLLIISLL